MYENHLSYITNVNAYAKKINVRVVNVISIRVGFKTTIFDELEGFDINVSESDRLFPYVIAFNCEAILKPFRIQSTEKEVWTQNHKYKLSSKGVQRHSVKTPLETFRSVLDR